MIDDGQQTLLPVYSVPDAIVDFLAGFAARFAFGEKPTAEQQRQAHIAGRDLATRLASLKVEGQRG